MTRPQRPTSMHALVSTPPHGLDRLSWRSVEAPPTGSGVLVRVVAAGVAWADLAQVQGRYVGGPDTVFVPGHEVSGRVVDTDGFDTRYRVGDKVMALLPASGGFAEYVAVAPELLSLIPPGVDDIAAAAIPSSFYTAQLAFESCRTGPEGAAVLIHAGAGGLGSAAIQVCRALGAELVIATVGASHKRRYAEDQGAHITCEYPDFDAVVAEATDGRGVDVALDSVGGDVLDRTFRVMADYGELITVGATAAQSAGPLKMARMWHKNLTLRGLHLHGYMRSKPAELNKARHAVQLGFETQHYRSPVGAVFDIEEHTTALSSLRDRLTCGRTVLTIPN